MGHEVSRRAFLHLAGLASVALTLSACQPSTPSSPQVGGAAAGATPGGGAAATPEPLSLPIVSQPLTLSYWAPMSTNVAPTMQSFGEIACYVELEKRTGIHLQFQQPPLQQEQDQFNLLVASGKYPDVVEFAFVM